VRTLVLVRHAKSDWSSGLADERRKLAPRGRREAPEAGRWLAEQLSGAVDVVVCSTAVRTRQTWELVGAALGEAPGEVRFDERAYAAPAQRLRAIVEELPAEARAAALIAHNPGIEDLATNLSGQECIFKTSTIMILTWDGPWAVADGAAKVQARWR
jgi:phosphohistidine phosphatase